jgi:hypothetical protein
MVWFEESAWRQQPLFFLSVRSFLFNTESLRPGPVSNRLLDLLFEAFEFTLQGGRNPVLGHIDVRQAHAQRFRNFRRRPFRSKKPSLS